MITGSAQHKVQAMKLFSRSLIFAYINISVFIFCYKANKTVLNFTVSGLVSEI